MTIIPDLVLQKTVESVMVGAAEDFFAHKHTTEQKHSYENQIRK